MESGNSGSFQSSTGDEEFDSHGDGISAVNNLAPAHVSSLANHHQQQQQPPLQPPCNTVSSYMYDRRQPQQPPPPQRQQQPLENNYQRSFMNSYVLDWSYNNNAQRSETNSTELFNPVYRHGSAPPSQPPPPPSAAENTRVVSVQQQPPPPIQEAKKTRKRSRASRGAATTVLTTDTTNFRAMVQEFTGIPEPPFPSSHPFQKTRLDNIFGTVSGITSPPPPPYLRRPFPQKINPPFSPSSSFWGPLSSSSSNTNALLTSSLNNNYQFTPQPQFSNQFAPSFLGMKTTNQHQESREFSSNDDFGGPTGFLGLISSDQRTSVLNNNQASVRWGNGNGTGTGSNQDDDHQSHVITTSAANSTNFRFSSS